MRAGEHAPLWPRGFDPLNVEPVDGDRVLHTRWLQVGNAHSTLEVLGRHVLTRAAGSHPLFDGLREVILAGLRTPPTVRLDEGMIVVSGEGFEGTFHGAHVECAVQMVIVELDHPALGL